MAHFKITKKHHPTGSLSRRILAITILLLVIPLFLQSLFLYRQEYEQRLRDVKTVLNFLAKERAHLVKQMIETDLNILNALGDTPNVKQLYIERIPTPGAVKDQFVLVSKSRQALLVGKKESGGTSIVIPIEFSVFGKELPNVHPVRLSLITDQGKMIWENMTFANPENVVLVKQPIFRTNLSLEVSVEKTEVHGLLLKSYYLHFATLLFFVGLIGGGAVYLFTRRISKPLKNLCQTMERVSEGASHARYTPDRMGFEINELGLQFNQTLDDLLRHAQLAERERLLREKLAEELRIGHDIQASLLPSHVPNLPNIDIATAYLASKEVNGDFYDLFRLENGHLLIAMCDTAGKGISACLFSLGLRSIIRSLANTTSDLSELIRRVNDIYMIDAHEYSMFSTLWLGIYHPTDQRLVYCSQGHPPAILRRGNEIQELWTQGIALGAQKLDVIQTKEIVLDSGDLLLLYTDGVIEAHDPDGQLFGKSRLNEWLLRKKRQTAQQVADQLVEEIHLFSQGARQHDDISLIALLWGHSK